MAFHSFDSPSRDFFGQTRFSDSVGQEASIAAGLAGDAVANKDYVLAVKRARQQSAGRAQPSTGSQIAGAVLPAAAGAAVSVAAPALFAAF